MDSVKTPSTQAVNTTSRYRVTKVKCWACPLDTPFPSCEVCGGVGRMSADTAKRYAKGMLREAVHLSGSTNEAVVWTGEETARRGFSLFSVACLGFDITGMPFSAIDENTIRMLTS